MMKNIYKPILFNTEMVQAILAGRKTQTRRICAHQYWMHSELTDVNVNEVYSKVDRSVSSKYQPGDILWVGETTKVGAWREDECKIAFDYKASPELAKTSWCFFDDDKFEKLHLETIEALDKKGFEADIDEEKEYCTYHWEPGESPLNWKPSLFMPKEAARIFLKVTNVRCERLLDIAEEDAIAEGIQRYGPFGEFKGNPHPSGGMMRFRAYSKAARAFQDLWDSINAKKHPWKSNPWVWVYDFERIEKPEEFLP